MVAVACWIVIAIGKHVIAQDALPGRNKCVCVDESTHLGIVITGLEIVELGFSVLKLSVRHS